jgi:magnesium chelatase family protein
MVTRVATVAFEGIEARADDVQVEIAPGNVIFLIVGLPDKAVAESRERVRSALIASGLALPAKRIVVNLAPADLPKEGSHYDLPIALGVMAAIGAVPPDALQGFTVFGELALDGTITAVAGVLPAAIAANARGHGPHLPAALRPRRPPGRPPTSRCLAPRSLNHSPTTSRAPRCSRLPEPAGPRPGRPAGPADIKGQESAKRTLEVAADGGTTS